MCPNCQKMEAEIIETLAFSILHKRAAELCGKKVERRFVAELARLVRTNMDGAKKAAMQVYAAGRQSADDRRVHIYGPTGREVS